MRLALLAFTLASCSTYPPPCKEPQWPKPVPGTVELGEGCNQTTYLCAPGLICLYTYNGEYNTSFCTVDCSDAGCPAGASCVPNPGMPAGSPAPAAACVASCQADSDCWKATARACKRDGDAGICVHVGCRPSDYSGGALRCDFIDCPGGYVCVGFHDPLCCDSENPCSLCQGGTCERQ